MLFYSATMYYYLWQMNDDVTILYFFGEKLGKTTQTQCVYMCGCVYACVIMQGD